MCAVQIAVVVALLTDRLGNDKGANNEILVFMI